jgi:hypothetical protein
MFDLSRIWESAEAGTIEKLVDCQDDARLSALSLSLSICLYLPFGSMHVGGNSFQTMTCSFFSSQISTSMIRLSGHVCKQQVLSTTPHLAQVLRRLHKHRPSHIKSANLATGPKIGIACQPESPQSITAFT